MKDIITVDVNITYRQICDNLIAAFESGHYGAMYWLRDYKYIGGYPKKSKTAWYDQPELLRQKGPIFRLIYDDPKKEEGNAKGKKDISLKDIGEGLQAMASKYSDAFALIAKDNADAGDADIMLQCIVFGEETYA